MRLILALVSLALLACASPPDPLASAQLSLLDAPDVPLDVQVGDVVLASHLLHRELVRDIEHRDVKPENVHLTPSKTAPCESSADRAQALPLPERAEAPLRFVLLERRARHRARPDETTRLVRFDALHGRRGETSRGWAAHSPCG